MRAADAVRGGDDSCVLAGLSTELDSAAENRLGQRRGRASGLGSILQARLPSPPWPLRWLGEQSPSAAALVLSPSATDADLARIQSLFPEMRVTKAQTYELEISMPQPGLSWLVEGIDQ